MNLVHYMIDLRPGAKALGFAAACDAWMSHLAASGAIRGWRLLRRKFGLASGPHADIVIEVEALSQFDVDFGRAGPAR